MKINGKIFLLIIVFGHLFGSKIIAQNPIKDYKSTVILISFDGFRWDYLNKYQPKYLIKLAKNGVRAKWMIPSFPTKTYPNHYTIATGIYPQNHGIVENNIYDFETVFSLSNRQEVENSRWWLGEPIWVTAENQGQISASMFFVGTETNVKGIYPTFWSKYDSKITEIYWGFEKAEDFSKGQSDNCFRSRNGDR